MAQPTLPFFYRFFSHMGAYTLLVVTTLNLFMVAAWSALLIHAIPPATPMTAATKVFITGFPLLMLQGTINAVTVCLSCEYSVFVRGRQLRIEIEADRTRRDAELSRTILSRIIESHEVKGE